MTFAEFEKIIAECKGLPYEEFRPRMACAVEAMMKSGFKQEEIQAVPSFAELSRLRGQEVIDEFEKRLGRGEQVPGARS